MTREQFAAWIRSRETSTKLDDALRYFRRIDFFRAGGEASWRCPCGAIAHFDDVVDSLAVYRCPNASCGTRWVFSAPTNGRAA